MNDADSQSSHKEGRIDPPASSSASNGRGAAAADRSFEQNAPPVGSRSPMQPSRPQDASHRPWAAPLALGKSAFTPPLAAWEASDQYFLRIDLPGVRRESVAMTLAGQALVIRGVRPEAAEIESERRSRLVPLAREQPSGSFSRVVMLPADALVERLEARIDKGCLEVRVPRAAGGARRKIAIR